MSNMYIEEFAELSGDGLGNLVPVALCNGDSTSQTIAFTGTAGTSAAFASTTRFIRVSCDAEAHLKFAGNGATPTATTAAAIQVQADVPEYFGVKGVGKISAIAAA